MKMKSITEFNYKGFKYSCTINGRFKLENKQLKKSVLVTLDNLYDGTIYSIIDFKIAY